VKEPVNGRAWRTRHVQTFCPRCFSAIRLPDAVLASRTIIIPLIRTANRDKANADPLDYRLWPIPRAQLLDDLWTLALSHCATMPAYDAQVGQTATLLGRNLEPWRAILAVAHWLTDCGVPALYDRIEALSQAYQDERPDLEPPDLTAWVIKALCHYATTATSATMPGGSQQGKIWEFPTKEIKQSLGIILQDEETGIDASTVSTDRIGRILGKLRLKKKPRKTANDPRQWQLPQEDLRRWLISYGMPLPQALFPQQPPAPAPGMPVNATSNVTTPQTPPPSGTSGTSGIVAQPGSPNGASVTGRGADNGEEEQSQDIRAGDWCYLLSVDGVQQNVEPYLIASIEIGSDGQHYARFYEKDGGWLLAQCERADPPAPVHGLPAAGADEFDEGVVV
jgi:hypothetical protein